MTRFARLFPAVVLAFVVAAGCVQAPDNVIGPVAPAVTISGAHGLVVGTTLNLSAVTSDGDDSGYVWAVLDTTVVSVDAAGLVTAVAPGETTVTATGKGSGAVGRHALVVVPTSSELPAEVVTSGAHGLVVGATVALSATTDHGSDASYTWVSLDPTVVTVDTSGVVTGVGVGETTVTATGADSGAVGRHALVVGAAATPPGPEVPNLVAWSRSGHADKTAEAFKHWNNDDPPQVPADCARCHSNKGFQDYIGEDGSAVGVTDAPAPVGSTVECQTCHNATTATLASVTFPSGVTVDGLGPEARCMTCHQGRASTDAVNEAIALAAAPTDDTPSDKLGFLNIHYYAAGATLYAGRVRGGYQYPGEVYDWRFRHVDGLDTCVGCHDPHSLEVRTDRCVECHQGASTVADLHNIRMMASRSRDYDGDGNTTEGIFFELEGLRDRLLTAIRTYATGEGFGAICYSAAVYPYWFKDSDDNGSCSAEEAAFPNRYATWTPRLVRAAYNYQVSLKDPGAFAHNAKYIIQLLHDATSDIATALGQPALIGSSQRDDFGHFNGASEAARHWDAGEQVDATCSKCHGGSDGFRFFLKYGVGTTVAEPDNGLDCATCHDSFGTQFSLVQVAQVTFPSGITIKSDDSTTNMCSTCHSGRESKSTIDAQIAANKLGFRNVHYLPAAAVRQGTAAKVGYEYDGRTYAGLWSGHPGGDGCNSCHSGSLTQHTFLPSDNFATCKTCHLTAATLADIRSPTLHGVDYDGDGNANEALADEVTGLGVVVLARMNDVVTAAGGTGICYDANAYPYFFIDLNGNGSCDGAAEATFANSFKAWTPALMKAAHNFQMSQKDPGAWAHNFNYIAQLLFDSVDDLGGSTTGLIRP